MAKSQQVRNQFKLKWHQYGTKRLFIRIWKSLLRRMGIRLEKFIVMKKTITHSETPPFPKIDVAVKELNWDELQKAAHFDFSPSKLDLFKKRLDDPGYCGFGAFHNGQLVYTCWIALHKLESSLDLTGAIQLADDEGILIDAYTHPDYRGLGLHTYMNAIRQNKLIELGKKKAIALLQYENLPARKSQQRVGLIPQSIILYKNFFGITRVKLKSIG